jgi:hypothetical protein
MPVSWASFPGLFLDDVDCCVCGCLCVYTVKKAFFVLASRQKITVLRTENPAVDTRTICLLPIEFF